MDKTSLVQAACWSFVASLFVAGGVGVWVLGEGLGEHMGLGLVTLYSGALVVSGAMFFYMKMRRSATVQTNGTNPEPTPSPTRA